MTKELVRQKEAGEELDHDWDRFQKLLKYLQSIGLHTRNIPREYFNDSTVRGGIPTPIVSDGADGIRMSYDKRRGLLIWFTNGFEDSKDETRKKVQEYWDNLEK